METITKTPQKQTNKQTNGIKEKFYFTFPSRLAKCLIILGFIAGWVNKFFLINKCFNFVNEPHSKDK